MVAKFEDYPNIDVMSPEKDQSEIETSIVWVLRHTILTELEARHKLITSWQDLLDGELLDEIMPAVEQSMADQGREYSSVDLLAAVFGNDGETGEETKRRDDPPRGWDGDSRRPLIPKPSDSSSGAEVERELEPDVNEDIENLFPKPVLSEPLRRVPRVPVGLILNSK